MDQIKDRIKKLLRLGRSTNANEAASALKAAWELARRHDLSIEELNLEKDLEPIAEKAFPVGERTSLEHKMAATIVSDYFNCRCILSRPDILIIGEEHHTTFGEFVLGFLVDAVRRGVKDHKAAERKARRVWNNNKRASYVRGFFYAPHAQLGQAAEEALPEPQQTALARVSRIDSYVDQRFSGQLTKLPLPKSRRNGCAVTAGFEHGKQTTIRNPLASDPRRAIEG